MFFIIFQKSGFGGRKMRQKRRTVAPFIGQQGAVTAFFGGKAA